MASVRRSATGLLRTHRDGLREIAFGAAFAVVYFGIRNLTVGSAPTAYANADRLMHLERTLHLAWEAPLQGAIISHPALVTLANWVYIWGHWPVIAAVAVWLWRRERGAYRLLRDAMFVSGAIGLAVFALYPVAPPRLAPLALVDSVTTWSHAYRALQPPALTNPYAAMPSLHVGWNLLVGLAIVVHARRRAVRILGALLPAAMAVAVVATANHFLLDVVAGVALALLGLAVASRLGRDTMRA
jgi:membrane-associated phospholipid phosphatase